MSEAAEFVEFMLILALLVIVFMVFLACVLLIDHYVRQFVGLMDSAINVSRSCGLGFIWEHARVIFEAHVRGAEVL